MWTAISNLGDAALTMPLAVVCVCWLTTSLHGWRIALSWVALLAAGMAIVGTTKILYAGCGIHIPSLDFRVISGHTMLATAVWPMVCLLSLHDGMRLRAGGALIPGLALAVIVGISRVFDEAHTVSEVIAGWMVGTLVTVMLLKRWKNAPILPPRLRPFAIGSLLMVSTVVYGHHTPIQKAIVAYSPFLCGRYF